MAVRSIGAGHHSDAVMENGQKLVLGRSIDNSIGSLAQTFRRHNRTSPFHDENPLYRMAPAVQELFQAWAAVDPPPNREEAITLNHLKHIYMEANGAQNHLAITHANLLIRAFFFAMRPCEYSKVPSRGRTKLLERSDISFTDDKHMVVPHIDPNLSQRSEYVSIQFRNQKNGHKIDKQSIACTKDPILCLIVAWAKIIGQLATERMPPSTTVNYVNKSSDPKRPTPHYISQQETITTL
jgi:hypothetical protein